MEAMLMAIAKISIETGFVGLTVRPGDTVILATHRSVSVNEFHEMRDRIEENLPGVKFVILDNATGLAVYTPEQVLKKCVLPPVQDEHVDEMEGDRM
jgi:hypothetical protein